MKPSPSFVKLQRAMTFDDRGVESVEDPDEHKFVPLKQRAQTFIEPSKRKSKLTVRALMKMEYSDVLHRRHFGNLDSNEPVSRRYRSESVTSYTDSVPDTIDTNKKELGACVIVDVFSTGAQLANTLYAMGYKLICVLSADLKDLLNMVPEGMNYNFIATIVFNTNIEEGAALQEVKHELEKLHTHYPIEAIMAGAETGVELSDQLSEYFGMSTTNGTQLSEARRNKYIMAETIRAAGLRAVRQLRATTWQEIESFIEEWNPPSPFRVIVKPMDSAGSDDVTLCTSLVACQQAFGNIMGKVNGLGLVNRAVLVQEYLEGTEYVVDIVSRDGVHKVIGLWEYDRRPANGEGFVLFGQKILSSDAPHCREIIAYQKKVIDALGIRNGPTHGEVKWFKGEPVLVEVGARCHGGDGLWLGLADECFGINQVMASIYAYLYPQRFHALPVEPTKCLAYGRLKWLISYETGTFQSTNKANLEWIQQAPGYRGHQVFLEGGKKCIATRNCFSWAGCIMMVGRTEEEVYEYYSSVESMEKKGSLFHIHPTPPPAPSMSMTTMVGVVDPFSTGAVLAHELGQRGYKVVAIYSEKLEQLGNLQNLVPEGLILSFEAIIAYDEDIKKIADSILAVKYPCVAIMAGAETGVELADLLSERLNLTTNGTLQSEARRNKYEMGETVRKAGLRAVKQLKAASWSEVDVFLKAWQQPSPFKAVVKPVDSAGSDSVTLCNSIEDVQTACAYLFNRINGLGSANSTLLIQEYLEGTEYVIDTVSKDGEHKVVALWEYDRRAVNGASFVCFGQKLLTVHEEPRAAAIIAYQKKVLDAIGIVHGPTHGEVKWHKGEPVLVEVGARCHGAEGVWHEVAKSVHGYSQVGCSIDSYLSCAAFKALPIEPIQRHCHGRVLFLINYHEGMLVDICMEALGEIHQMPSFKFLEMFVKKGSEVRKTIDCFGFAGMMRLVHEDEDQLVRDYERIRELEVTGLFVV